MNMSNKQEVKAIKKYTFDDRIQRIQGYLEDFRRQSLFIFITSSYKTSSAALLKIMSDYDKTIPVYFLNTGYHFPETISYKNQLTNLLGLNTIDIFSETPMLNQLNSNGRLLYTSDTDRCCELNKTLPLKKIFSRHDVWISGIRRDQSVEREIAKEIEDLDNGKVKYNPLFDWTSKDIKDFIDNYKLPKHPLDPDGFLSIGCQPCTRLFNTQTGRQNRWFGQTKTECGIHINFKEKS